MVLDIDIFNINIKLIIFNESNNFLIIIKNDRSLGIFYKIDLIK